jgi:hypothetical protein
MAIGGKASFAVAVGVHAAVFAALLLVPVKRPVAVAPNPPAAAEPEIDIVVDDPAPVAKDDVTSGNIASAPSAGAIAARSAGAVRPGPAEAPGGGEVPSESPAPPASSGGGVTFGGPNVVIDGANPFLGTLAREEEPPGESAKHRAEAALRQPARERERELGLGPEGPVLTALGDATYASTAPIRGSAIFFAVANSAGEVVSIDVLSCDGSRAGWAEAASIALESVKKKKLRMPSAAKRAEMKIEVTSAWKLPNGQDPGTNVSVLGLPINKGEGPSSTQVRILDPRSLTFFFTNGDPSNIGAKPRRIVHTHLVDSKVM